MTEEQLIDLFQKLDISNTGFITMADYRRTLKGYATEQGIRDTILEMDLDLNGQISLEEFRRHMQTFAQAEPEFSFPESIEDVDWFDVFVEYDKDGSGKLSAQELKILLEDMGKDVQRDNVLQLFREIDRDYDGVISYAEFVQHFGKPVPTESIDIKI